jgi:hypothetical protein
MITLSEELLDRRWDALPLTLRAALTSEVNSDFVRKTCESEHLPSERFHDVARVTGYVLMGFLHPEDMSEELKGVVGIDLKIASLVANAINQRIFAPLRQDIDKIYEPPSKLSGGPKILEEIISTSRIGPQIIGLAPVTTGAVPPATNQMRATTTPLPTAPPPVVAPKPKLPDIGWSKLTPEEPVVKLSQSAPQQSAPTPTGTISQSVQPPTKPVAIPIKGPVGEFERIAIQHGSQPVAPRPTASVIPTTSPATPTAPTGPAPVIIHEDTVFKPQQTTPDFHFQLPTENFNMQKGMGPAPTRPAVLELGKSTLPPAPPKPTSTPHVVHYTDYKSPSPENPQGPMTPQGPRKITEVTPQSTPPAAPRPETPKPIAPSPPPQTKVIYHDYTESSPSKSPTPQPPPLPPKK